MANKPGRPISLTVDYFPHMTKHGKTLPIVESKFGNDGYATWFKVLEMLGQARGHFYDCRNPIDFEFLAQKCRIDEVRLTEILDLFAYLGAIDADLWEERIIWSDNFIYNIEPLYRKRKTEIPRRPDFSSHKPEQAPISGTENPSKPGFPSNKPLQSRVEKSRVNKESGKPDLPDKQPWDPKAKKLIELLDESCNQIAQLKAKDGHRFNPWQFVVWCGQRAFHQKAVSHVLDLLVVNWPKIENPWTYACKIIEKESGNFYERDNGEIAEQEKSEWLDLVARLKAVHGNGG